MKYYNSNKETLGVRSAVLRDGSLDNVFANCIRIVTKEYVNNIVIGHGILAGTYLAEYRDSLK